MIKQDVIIDFAFSTCILGFQINIVSNKKAY